MMHPSEPFLAVQRAQLECLGQLFDVALDASGQLARLQLRVLRESAQRNSQALLEMLASPQPQMLAGLPARLLDGRGAQVVRYVEQVGELTGAMQAGFTQALQQGMDAMQRGMQASADGAQPSR